MTWVDWAIVRYARGVDADGLFPAWPSPASVCSLAGLILASGHCGLELRRASPRMLLPIVHQTRAVADATRIYFDCDSGDARRQPDGRSVLSKAVHRIGHRLPRPARGRGLRIFGGSAAYHAQTILVVVAFFPRGTLLARGGKVAQVFLRRPAPGRSKVSSGGSLPSDCVFAAVCRAWNKHAPANGCTRGDAEYLIYQQMHTPNKTILMHSLKIFEEVGRETRTG